MRGIRIARFSELYLFIFQQIQLVMVLLGVGIVRQRKPGAEAGVMIKNSLYGVSFLILR